MRKWLSLVLLACLTLALLAPAAVADDCAHTSKHLVDTSTNVYTMTGVIDPDNSHKVIQEAWQYWECDNCGQRFSGAPNPTLDKEWLEPHTYENGVCTVCGYGCQHPNAQFQGDDWVNPTYADNVTSQPNLYHTTTYEVWENVYCPDCHTYLNRAKNPAETYSEEQEHSYDSNGVCQDCGHVNTCSHPNPETDMEPWSDYENAVSVNERLHRMDIKAEQWEYCPDCGMVLSTKFLGAISTKYDMHDYNDEGVCEYCGHVNACTHPQEDRVADDGYYSWGASGGITFDHTDAQYHYIKADTASKYVFCRLCGAIVDRIEENNVLVPERHNYNDDGECYDCGYKNTCKHVNTETDEYVEYMCGAGIEDIGNDDYHLIRGDIKGGSVWCADCGQWLSDLGEVRGGDFTQQEPHDYYKGVCLVCGHVKSAATPTPTPAPTPTPTAAPTAEPTVAPTAEPTVAPTVEPTAVPTAEPTATPVPKTSDDTEESKDAGPVMELVYEPVNENTVINGIKVADHPTMAQAMETVGESLEGENVEITIPGVEKLLDAAELTRFNQLGVQDRLLVTLSALGFADALGESADALSPDAKALADDITARMASLSEADRQKLLDVIATEFPTVKVVVDGQSYDGFTIDVVIDRGGNKTYQRYTFYNDGTQWILHNIEVGEYKVIGA